MGLDCLGLVVCAIGGRARELDERGYAAVPDGARLQSALDAYFDRLDVGHPDEAPTGAVLAFRAARDRSGMPRHLAIRTDAGMIHAIEGSKRGVLETDLSRYWADMFVGAYAWRQ